MRSLRSFPAASAVLERWESPLAPEVMPGVTGEPTESQHSHSLSRFALRLGLAELADDQLSTEFLQVFGIGPGCLAVLTHPSNEFNQEVKQENERYLRCECEMICAHGYYVNCTKKVWT